MENNKNIQCLKIHFFYVVLILSLTVILLATFRWTALPGFTSYLSTAATITSLVLGLLAIIYAYISNDALSQSTGIMTSTATQASESAVRIRELLDDVGNMSEENQNVSLVLKDISKSISIQIDALKQSTSTLSLSTENIHEILAEALAEIPKGLGAIEKRLADFQTTEPVGEKKINQPNNVDELLSTLVDKASGSGLILLYACYLSKINQKEFDLAEFSGGFSSKDYFHGFFIAVNSLRVLEAEVSGAKITIFDCPEVFESAKYKFEERIEKLKLDSSKEKWKSALITVESYFNQ